MSLKINNTDFVEYKTNFSMLKFFQIIIYAIFWSLLYTISFLLSIISGQDYIQFVAESSEGSWKKLFKEKIN